MKTVNIRDRDGEQLGTMSIDAAITFLREQVDQYQ